MKKPSFSEGFFINGQLPTFALACTRLSSARPRFTSEFEMGSGRATAYMPPNPYLQKLETKIERHIAFVRTMASSLESLY